VSRARFEGGLRVLVADGAAVSRALASAVLSFDYDVAEAADLEEATARLHDHRPDLVLVDLGLPPSGGLAFVDTVLHTPRARGVPIVVATFDPANAELRECFARGCAFITKPLSAWELHETVRLLLARAASA
jgi:CheY-like chemotaxis protein